eukprot:CAMPEP_0178911296 /NCGR_PEP_ID=MMETSP0786-20121207/9614_1 /TAXON_ID=186022 /ORGANISM="Thalassionema frauenfeldii, Strain CCMP 1798" /LENGTH=109 /DNA_ID=CAMNT_0020583723 /DNA_START=419 /DNA_END=748 /DNA_ORIENTATION=-
MDQTVASLQDQIIGMLENNKTNDRLLRKCQQHQQRQLNQFAHAFDLLFKKFDIDASSLPVVDDMPSEFNSSSSSVKPSKAAYYKPSMVNMLVEFVKFTKTPMGAGTHKS